MSQTVIVRFRPLKLLSIICAVIAIILIIIALAGVWLTTKDDEVSDSLWVSCEAPNPCGDPAASDGGMHQAWLNAVRAFAIISLLLCVGATILRILGVLKGDQAMPWSRNVAVILMVFAMFSIIIALIVFPVKTLETLPYRSRVSWQFHWAYGVAWGGVIFMLGFVILLFLPSTIDQTEDPAKKVYYVNSGGQFETNA